MCGILAIIQTGSGPIPDIVRRNAVAGLSAMNHRGPDDHGLEDYGSVILAQRRLSIIDLSPAGHQPMHSIDRNLSVTFNGQIYNWKSLRTTLEKAGHVHRTQCDTEILLTAYAHYGPDFVDHLVGMWAFVLHDRKNNRVIVSRDRLGIKPLYQYEQNGVTVFASEIKAILKVFPDAARVDERVLKRYVTRGWMDNIADTLYHNVKLYPAGHVSQFTQGGEWSKRRFWAHPTPSRTRTDLKSWHDLFVQVVEDHIQSDAPLATTLSGGLDSNAINGVIARTLGRGKNLNAFSVVAPDTADESFLIDQAVKDLGINHEYIDIGDVDYVAAIDDMLNIHDEPTITAGQVNQFIFRGLVAKRGFKVLLVGEGADEILSGYAKIIPSYLADLMAQGEVPVDTLTHFETLSGQSGADMMAAVVRLRDTGYGRRAIQTTMFGYDLFEPGEKLDDHFLSFDRDHANVDPAFPGAHTYREMMDRLTIDIPQVLRNEDRNSMAHGIESRPPFMDHRLFEMSWEYPFEMLMQGGRNKAIMRDALTREIPAQVLENQKKFRRPGSITDLVYNRLAGAIRSIIMDPGFADLGFWNRNLAAMFDDSVKRNDFDQAFIWLRVYMLGRVLKMRFAR